MLLLSYILHEYSSSVFCQIKREIADHDVHQSMRRTLLNPNFHQISVIYRTQSSTPNLFKWQAHLSNRRKQVTTDQLPKINPQVSARICWFRSIILFLLFLDSCFVFSLIGVKLSPSHHNAHARNTRGFMVELRHKLR